VCTYTTEQRRSRAAAREAPAGSLFAPRRSTTTTQCTLRRGTPWTSTLRILPRGPRTGWCRAAPDAADRPSSRPDSACCWPRRLLEPVFALHLL